MPKSGVEFIQTSLNETEQASLGEQAAPARYPLILCAVVLAPANGSIR